MTQPLIRRRAVGDSEHLSSSLHPVLRRVYASRGASSSELDLELRTLLPPSQLLGVDAASTILEDAIRGHRKIVIAGDYDADGATGTALAVLGLRAIGTEYVDYVVPDRFRMGYGLSPALAELAGEKGAQVLVTVDNGIASIAGVARAKELGMQVVVTDHHLAGSELPTADAIVNPNQPGCGFSSKHLAGVGVMFCVLLALRARLRDSGWFTQRAEPRLADFLDLVALGTIADVVKLDHNNRILVQHGLLRIRAGRGRPGIHALLKVAGRRCERLSSTDLGFVLGPRINAAGRLEDIRIGIECLLSDSEESALALARQLDQFNRDRRELETQMRDEALVMVEENDAIGVCIFDLEWHEGIVGLVASRVKDKLHRPAIAFARSQEAGLLKGSGRSIAGLHLRDALVAVDTHHPGMIQRFGGHAMAAGLTLPEQHYEKFCAAFNTVCSDWLDAPALERVLETDGELAADELCLETALAIEGAGPWGQGFPEPLFEGEFQVLGARVVGEKHVKYRLAIGGSSVDAIHFGGLEQMRKGGTMRAVYRAGVNRYMDSESLDLLIQHIL